MYTYILIDRKIIPKRKRVKNMKFPSILKVHVNNAHYIYMVYRAQYSKETSFFIDLNFLEDLRCLSHVTDIVMHHNARVH